MRKVVTLILVACALPASFAHARATPAPAEQAERLYQQAVARLAHPSVEARRVAILDLEQATLLTPGNPAFELLLARTYYQAGFLKLARRRFERVTRLRPEDAQGRYGLGQVWRRDWLKYLDTTSLVRAVENLSTSARLEPRACDTWLMLVPLLVEQRDLRAAATAAARALDADPRRPEALLAVGYTAYRLGRMDTADSAFASAIPRLKRTVREVFEDISPVASATDTMTLHHLPAAEQPEFVRRFWKENDPDPVTPENEAQLEYWSRAAHAFFLFYDPKRREWDERGEVYVRYGPPEKSTYNPVGERLSVSFGTGPAFPANLLVWDYPSLGMSVTMQDRLLSEYYLLPIALSHDTDPKPDADSLARRGGESVALRGGRGVFRLLPPGVTPVPVHGAVARFETDRGPRLLAQIETAGEGADSARADWVVLDSTRHEVARGTRELSPSVCDATAHLVADFAAEVPPGEYLIGLSVNDRAGHRGVYRTAATVPPVRHELGLSDVVISCGPPQVTPARAGEPPSVRLEPNPEAEVHGGEPLTAYFEIYHLTPAADGMAAFEYVYTVRSNEKDTRVWLQRALSPRPSLPSVSASREEQNPGALRRQFVSVPVEALPAGKYRLEIEVRDRVAGLAAKGHADFVKRDAPAPR